MRVCTRRSAAWVPSFVLFAMIFVSTFSSADEGGPLYGPADTIRVEAEAPDKPVDLDRLPFFASVKDLAGSSGRLLTIADILEESAGVRVRRFGGLGAFATASIRGSAPGQVEIYLDGIPLNSAEWGAVNLAELPVDNLVRAEIFRSGAPVALGASGIGGAVNLVTHPARDGHTSFALTAGSYDTWKTYALRSGTAGGGAYLLSYRHLQTRGDFEFLYDRGTRTHNVADDTVLTRTNNAFREHTLLGKLRLPPLAGWTIELVDDWYLKESGLPGHGNLIYEEASFDNRRHRTSLAAASPGLLRKRVRADLGAYRLDRRDRYYNPGKEPTLHLSDLIHRSEADGGHVLVTAHLLRARQTLRARADLRRESFEPEDGNPAVGKGFPRERRVSSLSLEDECLLFRERLSLYGALRWTESKDNFHGVLPYGPPPEPLQTAHSSGFRAATLGAHADLAPFLSLRASRARAGRLPTLFELFGTNGDVRPSPFLVPEEGTTWDGGFRLRAPEDGPIDGFLDISVFRSKRDSLIVFIQNSQRNFKAVNLEEADAEGVEIEWKIEGGALRADGSFTSQDVRQRGSVPHWKSKWVPYVSAREFFSRLSLRLGRIELRHEYNRLDPYFRDRANTEEDRAAARNIHNVGARIRFRGDRFLFDLDVQNIGDEKSADSFGYPMPGRTVYLTAAVEAGGGRRARKE
ncbi:MAG: TonB-dependent receptor [Candidatus Eisenbacteria bacterium]|nr:TonB-dependent receptor [Candidatus Eisenbacteria bacterium]